MQPRILVGAKNQAPIENQLEDSVRVKLVESPRPRYYFRGNIKIVDFDRPLVLPPLSPGHIFVATSRLMRILTIRCLFFGLPLEDPHAHISKIRAVSKSFVGRPDLDMDVIGLRLFSLSLIG